MSDDVDPQKADPDWQYGPTQERPAAGPPSYGAQQHRAPPPPQYGSQQYGVPQHGVPQYGVPQHGSQQYGAPQYGAQPPGTVPPGGPYPGTPFPGGRPPSSGPSTGLIVGIVLAVVAVLAIGGGAVVWFVTNQVDDAVTAAARSSSSTSSWPTDTSDDPYSTYPSYTPPTYTTPTPSVRTYYGSIAVDRTTGNIGWSIDNLTQSAAVNAAMRKCESSSCETVLQFWNSCGAVAQSQENLYWGWASSASQQEAIDQAMANVQGGSPKLLVSKCTTYARD